MDQKGATLLKENHTSFGLYPVLDKDVTHRSRERMPPGRYIVFSRLKAEIFDGKQKIGSTVVFMIRFFIVFLYNFNILILKIKKKIKNIFKNQHINT